MTHILPWFNPIVIEAGSSSFPFSYNIASFSNLCCVNKGIGGIIKSFLFSIISSWLYHTIVSASRNMILWCHLVIPFYSAITILRGYALLTCKKISCVAVIVSVMQFSVFTPMRLQAKSTKMLLKFNFHPQGFWILEFVSKWRKFESFVWILLTNFWQNVSLFEQWKYRVFCILSGRSVYFKVILSINLLCKRNFCGRKEGRAVGVNVYLFVTKQITNMELSRTIIYQTHETLVIICHQLS